MPTFALVNLLTRSKVMLVSAALAPALLMAPRTRQQRWRTLAQLSSRLSRLIQHTAQVDSIQAAKGHAWQYLVEADRVDTALDRYIERVDRECDRVTSELLLADLARKKKHDRRA